MRNERQRMGNERRRIINERSVNAQRKAASGQRTARTHQKRAGNCSASNSWLWTNISCQFGLPREEPDVSESRDQQHELKAEMDEQVDRSGF